MKYEIILFDADNTLFDFDKAAEEALRLTFEEFGLPFTQEWFVRYRKIDESLWLKLEEGKITSEELRWRRFALLLGDLPEINPVELSDSYLKYLGQGRFLLPGAKEVVEALAKKYVLAVVTNGLEEVQLARFKGSPLEKYINHLIISETAGYNKPHPGIFDYTFKRIQHLEKSNVLMVGDSLTSDIKGGLNYGIDTCWYNPQGTNNESAVMPTYEIRHLCELLDLLDKNASAL